jgi:hypothetical protein
MRIATTIATATDIAIAITITITVNKGGDTQDVPEDLF